MKHLSTFIISFVLVSLAILPAFALVDAKVEPSPKMDTNTMLLVDPNLDKTLQDRTDKEIRHWITSLENLIIRVNKLQSISAGEKNLMTTQIQTEIERLTTLQTKIKANPDPLILKNEKQSLIASYRTYALFMPKVAIIVAADHIGETADQLSLIATKLQGKIDAAETQGKDITSLEITLSAMQKKIADAKTQKQNAVRAVMPLTPQAYSGNKTTLTSAREMLKLGYQDLVAARQNAKKIIYELK